MRDLSGIGRKGARLHHARGENAKTAPIAVGQRVGRRAMAVITGRLNMIVHDTPQGLATDPQERSSSAVRYLIV